MLGGGWWWRCAPGGLSTVGTHLVMLVVNGKCHLGSCGAPEIMLQHVDYEQKDPQKKV